MISVTILKNLLDAGNYQEFQNVLNKHFSGEDKMDVASSQKVTNIIAFHITNESKFDFEIFSMLTKYFRIALDCLIQNDIKDPALSEKICGSCHYVSSQKILQCALKK